MRQVLLFGSWVRGDADPESDIDLMVVLDHVDDVREEVDRMEPILWNHTDASDGVSGYHTVRLVTSPAMS